MAESLGGLLGFGRGAGRGKDFRVRLDGGRALERKFKRFPDKLQARIRRKALKASVLRLQQEMLINLSGRVANEQTGTLVNALESEKPTARTRKRKGIVSSGIRMPSRARLGIRKGDKHYWPLALEYGHRGPKGKGKFVRARKFARRAIDDHIGREVLLLGRDIGRDAIRIGKKKGLL